MSVKKTPIESTLAEFMNVASIPAPAPRCAGGSEFMTPAAVGRREEAHADPVQQEDEREPDVREVDRQHDEQQEAHRREHHPAGRERPRAEAGLTASPTPGRRRGTRRSAGACRCPPTAASARSRNRAAGSQIPCSQMMRMNCRPPRPIADRSAAMLPAANARMRKRSRWNIGSSTRVSITQNTTSSAMPPSSIDRTNGDVHPIVVAAVRLDPVRDPDHHADEAEREGRVPPPVDAGRATHAELAERVVRPDGRNHADRHRDEEDEPPRHGRQHAAEDEPEERAGDRGDEFTPIASPRWCTGNASVRIALEFANRSDAADALPDAHENQPDRARAPVHPRDGEQDREDGEHGEAEVEHPHAAVHVAEPAEADEQHGHHHHEPEDQPEEVARVSRRERVDTDAAEDVRQRDQQDGGVDRRHQHPEGGVRERHPLVVEPSHIDVYVKYQARRRLRRACKTAQSVVPRVRVG